MACSELKNRPPSEKLSGVTLRIPIITGRRSPSSFARASEPSFGEARLSAGGSEGNGWAGFTTLALRRGKERSQGARDRAVTLILVHDLERQIFGVLDPTDYELFRGQKTDQLLGLVGLRHGFCEVCGIAVLELPARGNADW